MAKENLLVIPYKLFDNVIGHDHDNDDHSWTNTVKLAEGDVDPRTGGAVAVTSNRYFDKDADVLKLLINYWRIRPNGEQLQHNLFDIEYVESPEAGGIAPQSIWVMGRKLYDHDNDNVLSISPGLVRNINRAQSAVQFIHRDIREGRLPQIAKIFKEVGLQESIGENLPIVGLSSAGGFDFNIHEQYARSPNADFRIPTDVVKPLLGLGTNTIDKHQQLGPSRLTTAVDPRHGTMFAAEVIANDNEDSIGASMRIDPINVPDDKQAYAIPNLATAMWHAPANHNISLEELKFLGVDVMKADHTTRMKIIGVINKILHDFRRRGYPVSIDHLTEFDMHDWADSTDAPPQKGRFVVTSQGGNNMEEIADGYGNQINGNCKYVENQWLNSDGVIKRLGVIHDLGLFLPSIDEPNKSAAPDIVHLLQNIEHLFFTHRHLDHTDGAIAYIAKGYFRGKIVHASPECIRSIREKLAAYEIPKEYYPTFSVINGKGWIHLKDADGIVRMSVGYSVDGTPHTARCTPFVYVARNGSEVLGSYLNHGDARYGHHNADDYTGFKPDADYLDKDFFQNWAASLAKDDPTVDQSIIGRRATLADFDITSIRQRGWSPTNWEVEDNKTEILGWFEDFGIVDALISTNETGLESIHRVATRLGRDLTEFGANIEHTATTANVMGVNKLRVEPEERQNIQHYLDHYFMQLSDERLALLQSNLKAIEKDNFVQREKIEHDIAIENKVREYFAELSSMKEPYKRYDKRLYDEIALREEFGVSRRLGAIRVTRTTETSKKIFTGAHGRRYVAVTGTQGNFVEIDATLYKLSEGRSLFDLKREVRHTARPLKASENVVCISQTAIPGNEKKQKDLVDRLIMRGFIVIVAVRGGFDMHNVHGALRQKIINNLKEKNRDFVEQQDGTLSVHHMPIHPPGHGYEDDAKAWLSLIRADFSAPQHTADPQAVRRFGELAEADDHAHAGRIFENFERIQIEMGATPAESQIKTIGRSIPSIILIEVIRKIRQYYGGHIEATRVVKLDGQGGLREDGLMASSKPKGLYRQHFATVGGEVARRKAAGKKSHRPEPIAFNRTPPLPERRYLGPRRPGAHRRQTFMQAGHRLSALAARTQDVS